MFPVNAGPDSLAPGRWAPQRASLALAVSGRAPRGPVGLWLCRWLPSGRRPGRGPPARGRVIAMSWVTLSARAPWWAPRQLAPMGSSHALAAVSAWVRACVWTEVCIALSGKGVAMLYGTFLFKKRPEGLPGSSGGSRRVGALLPLLGAHSGGCSKLATTSSGARRTSLLAQHAADAVALRGRGPPERRRLGTGRGRRLSHGRGGASGIFGTPRWGSHMLSRLDSAGGHAQAPLPEPGTEFTQPRFWS